MTPHATFAALGAALLAVGCGNDFAAYNQVSGLRILALQSDPPSLLPGQTAALRALVAAPDGAEVRYHWRWCPAVGSGNDGYPCMLDEQSFRGELNAVLMGAGEDAPDYELGTAPTALFPYAVSPLVLADACQTLIEASLGNIPEGCTTHFVVHVKLTVTTDTDSVTALMSLPLFYNGDVDVNVNPSIADVGFVDSNGFVPFAEETSHPASFGTSLTLRAVVEDTAAQTYLDERGQQVRERLLFTWFVDAGETDEVRTIFIDGSVPLVDAAQNVWTLPAQTASRSNDAHLWLVMRDNRGGVTWQSRTLTLGTLP